jgi:hypothetical protein
MTSQSSGKIPKTHVETAQNSAKHYKTQVMRAVFHAVNIGSIKRRFALDVRFDGLRVIAGEQRAGGWAHEHRWPTAGV